MEITSSAMLKPVYSVPHPLAGEKVPLTVFDHAALDLFVPTVVVYPAPAPSNEALKEGLLRAVAPYPHLAGRLAVDHRGRRFLHVNNEGVLVIECTVPVNLVDAFIDGRMAAGFDNVYPIPPEENVGAALLQIQLNRYNCGGLVIGMCAHHHAADGHSMSTFFTVWASAVRDGKDFTAPSPSLDRAAIVVPRSPPTPVFDHRSVEFKCDGEADTRVNEPYAAVSIDRIKNLTVHFTADFIAALKSRVGARCSTFQCLLAHIWKKVTAARDLNPEEFTKVRVGVNCRARANPPVSMDFFGNMVLWAFPRLQARDVLGWSYGDVVGAIRDATARINEEYIQSFMDFGAVAESNGEELAATTSSGTMLCPDIEAESWLGFRFHQMDLGTGPPSMFLPPDIPLEGLIILVPSCKGNGGVDVFMTVAEEHAVAFEQICYSMDSVAEPPGGQGVAAATP